VKTGTLPKGNPNSSNYCKTAANITTTKHYKMQQAATAIRSKPTTSNHKQATTSSNQDSWNHKTTKN
jgi:hypothetical protein